MNFGGVELPGGASEKELRWSYWWVTHRDQVGKAAIGAFIAFDAVLVLFGAWGFVDWLALGGLDEERAMRQFTSGSYASLGGSGDVQEIRIGAPIVLSAGKGKLDALVTVENVNARYWAEIEYRFVAGGVELPERESFVLPGQAKYLAELGIPSDAGGSVELRVTRRAWHPIETFGAEDYQALLDTRLNIEVQNAKFIPADPLATNPVSISTFTIRNGTAFGYYDIGLMVLLYRGDAIVGATRAGVDRLRPGERRNVDLFWYQSLGQVTRVEVIPDINIFDPGVYRAPGR